MIVATTLKGCRTKKEEAQSILRRRLHKQKSLSHDSLLCEAKCEAFFALHLLPDSAVKTRFNSSLREQVCHGCCKADDATERLLAARAKVFESHLRSGISVKYGQDRFLRAIRF